MAKSESLSSPRRITARQREEQAIALRLAGATQQAIADKIGYRSAEGARKALARAMARIGPPEDVERARQLETARLDRALMAIWPQVTKGDYAAIDRLVKLSKRRSEIMGLDAPVKIAPTDPTGIHEWRDGVAPERWDEVEMFFEEAVMAAAERLEDVDGH